MEKSELYSVLQKQIFNNLVSAREQVLLQTNRLNHLLIDKIADNFKTINKEKLQSLFTANFVTTVIRKFDYIFNQYDTIEKGFYEQNLKTADLILNTINDKSRQTIYLEDIIKRIHKKEDGIKDIFGEQMRNPDDDKKISINELFSNFVILLSGELNLTSEEAKQISEIAEHYYQTYVNDVTKTMKNIFETNKINVITSIDNEMDKHELRDGKNSVIIVLERSITNDSIRVMDELLGRNISVHKNKANDELKMCSTAIIDLIFKLLPLKYQEQKYLLEIIIDTNINARLGNLLEKELNAFTYFLKNKNNDILVNEFYETKRYRQIEDYVFDYNMIDEVYKSILHEISIAYDIMETDPQFKRLSLLVLSEGSSTKTVFKNLFNHILFENNKNLSDVKSEMHKLSNKAYTEYKENKQTEHKK